MASYVLTVNPLTVMYSAIQFFLPQGELLNYNNCRADWRIDATDVTIEMGADTFRVENARFLFRTSNK